MFKNCPPLVDTVTEENQLVVYLIVRESLGMSAGKIGGQCGHAIQYLMQEYIEVLMLEEGGGFDIIPIMEHFFYRMTDWMNSKTHTKIVLKASDKEWEKIKEEYDPIVVVDMGKTEIAVGSETVIALYPMFRSERAKTLQKLQLFK